MTMEEKRFVIYQGVRMIEGWPEKILSAQHQPTYSIQGKDVPRVRYGDESDDWGADKQPCQDCRVIKGQFHVPGCDIEECPVCHEQKLSCEHETEVII
jgi:hypothetical protein